MTALAGLVVLAFSGLVFATARSSPDSGPAAAPPAPFWWVFIVLVLFVHFFRPASFPVWPLADDGRVAFYSLDLAQNGQAKIQWGETQIQPAAVWIFGSILKFVPLNNLTIRMIPSVLSLLAMAVAYGALKGKASPPFVLYFCWFLGLGFWMLSFSRMFMGHSLHVILEMGALGALGKTVREKEGSRRSLWVLALALAAGLDFDLALHGAALLAAAALSLLVYFAFHSKGGLKDLLLFFAAVAAVTLPVVLGEARAGGMNYLLSQRAAGLNWNYLIALFWDGLGSAPYGPAWGGCFNPIVGSLALFGFLSLWRKGSRWMALGVLGALGLFLAPGLLSTGAEMFRVLSVLPVILGLAAWGLERLSGEMPKAYRWPVVGLLLCFSAGMDLYHYFGPYQDLPSVRSIWRNSAFASMDERLEESRRAGNRLGILDFTVNDYDDHTFDVLTRPLDGFTGPEGGRAQVDRIALVADVHYRPFLEKRFPGEWFSFPEKFEPGDPGWTLGLLPCGEMGGDELGQWLAAADAFRRVRSRRMYWERYQPMDPLVRGFLSQEDLFGNDPFLKSVFWEEAALLFNVQHNLPYALACYQNAVAEGYPAAHLYNERGTLEALKGSSAEAKADFMKALQAPLNRTAAAANLQWLEEKP